MKIIIILFFSLILIQCRPYFDNVSNGTYESKPWNYVVTDDYILMSNRCNVSSGSHGVYHKPQNYNIKVPRKIISQEQINSSVYINYSFNQLLIIDAGYKHKEFIREEWQKIYDDEKVFDYIEDYYSMYKKNIDYDKLQDNLKAYEFYFDGQTYILFYNMKNNNFNKELILSSLEYVD